MSVGDDCLECCEPFPAHKASCSQCPDWPKDDPHHVEKCTDLLNNLQFTDKLLDGLGALFPRTGRAVDDIVGAVKTLRDQHDYWKDRAVGLERVADAAVARAEAAEAAVRSEVAVRSAAAIAERDALAKRLHVIEDTLVELRKSYLSAPPPTGEPRAHSPLCYGVRECVYCGADIPAPKKE